MITTALAFATALALQVPAPPTKDEKIAAAQTLAKLWAAQTDPKSQVKAMLSMGIVGVVQEMAGVTAADDQAAQAKKMQAVVADLKAKHVDVSGPVSAVLADFMSFECRSKQSEAKGNLKALYVAEESYRAEFDKYDKDTKKIGFEPRGSKLRYKYELVTVSATAFTARAIGVDDMAGDEWTITDKNDLVNTKNKCAAP